MPLTMRRRTLPSGLSRIFASTAVGPPWPEMVRVAGTVLAALLIGLAVGHLEFAIFVAISSLRVSVGANGSIANRLAHVGGGAVFALVGYAVGRPAGGDGVTPVIVLAALGAITAVVSYAGPSLSFAGSQLIIFASVSGGLPHGTPLWVALGALALGAAWGLFTSILEALLVGAAKTSGSHHGLPPLRSLVGPRTRRYGVRLVLTLAVADVVRQVVPFDNAYWVILTVAVSFKPDAQPLIRGLQRALGTLVGVGLGVGILMLRPDTAWLLVVLTLLAALLPYCIARNYALYATLLTPFVVLLLDLPAPVATGVIVGRLADTALGAAVVIIVGYLIWPNTWRRSPVNDQRPSGSTPLKPEARDATQSSI